MFKLNRPLMVAVAVGLFVSTSYAEIVTIRTASANEVVLWVEGVKWRVETPNPAQPDALYDTMDQACAVAVGLLPDGSAPPGYYDVTSPNDRRFENPKGIYDDGDSEYGWMCQYDQVKPSYIYKMRYQNLALPSYACPREQWLVPAYLRTYADRIPCKYHPSYKPQ